MQSILRILQIATYPFLALSLLLLCNAFGFGSAFIADFTIHNQTTHTITVIPIGTVGAAGRRYPLPLTLTSYLNLPAISGRSFRLPPGKQVVVSYDWDDINFSELVVQNEKSEFVQLVTDPNPHLSQYHRPGETRYVIKDLAQLQPPPTPVVNAAVAALRGNSRVLLLYLLLICPWIAYFLTAIALRKSIDTMTVVSNDSLPVNQAHLERPA